MCVCEKFEARLLMWPFKTTLRMHFRHSPPSPTPSSLMLRVHVFVCLCLPYLLVELIIMILIQGKDLSTNWILPIPLN